MDRERLVITPPSLLPQLLPTLVRDVLRMKRNRGDNDADRFKEVAIYALANRLDATISGAARTVRCMVEQSNYPAAHEAEYLAFIADLDAVLSGDMRGWDVGQVEAA